MQKAELDKLLQMSQEKALYKCMYQVQKRLKHFQRLPTVLATLLLIEAKKAILK